MLTATVGTYLHSHILTQMLICMLLVLVAALVSFVLAFCICILAFSLFCHFCCPLTLPSLNLAYLCDVI